MSTYAAVLGGVQCKKGQTETGIAGETLAAGDFIYKDTDNKWYKANATLDLVGKKVAVAISKADAADEDFTLTQESGAKIDLGVTIGKGVHLFPNASGVPADSISSDLVSTNRINFWGYGDGTDLIFSPQLTDIQK